nr:TonB family protein [uncultured Cohaesibacter sp.]
MKRLILWILGIAAGVLLHLAIAFAYWAELDGESRYDLGGAFAGNMQVSIMPDMGQGLAGSDTETSLTNDDMGEGGALTDSTSDEPAPVVDQAELVESEEAEVLSAPEPVDAETVETGAIKPEILDQTPDEVAEQAPQVVADGEPKPVKEAASTKEVAPPVADVLTEQAPATIPEAEPTQPLAHDKQVNLAASDLVETSDTKPELVSEAEVEPQEASKPEVLPAKEQIGELIAQAETEEQSTEPAEPVAPVSEQKEPALALDKPADTESLPDQAPVLTVSQDIVPEDVEAPQDDVKQVSLIDGDALTALPAAAPRAKIKPAPKSTKIAKSSVSSAQANKRVKVASFGGGKEKASGKAKIRGDGGRSDKASGAGSRGVRVSYAMQLRRWIERHKRYPRSAKMRGVEGSGVVRIVIDRSGRVLQVALVKSAGDRALDDEIRTLPRRASPAPKPPAEFAGAKHTLTLPVKFTR